VIIFVVVSNNVA